MSHLTYAEAMVVGLIQGVTELFPVSSLGHNVLIPALIGGQLGTGPERFRHPSRRIWRSSSGCTSPPRWR